jgi:chromosome segregation ATPase
MLSASDTVTRVAEIDETVAQIDDHLVAAERRLYEMRSCIETMEVLLAQSRHKMAEAEQRREDIHAQRLKLVELRRRTIGGSS